MLQGMGRAATDSTKTGVYLDPALKKRAAIWALRQGITLSELVSRALVAYLAPAKRPDATPDP